MTRLERRWHVLLIRASSIIAFVRLGDGRRAHGVITVSDVFAGHLGRV